MKGRDDRLLNGCPGRFDRAGRKGKWKEREIGMGDSDDIMSYVAGRCIYNLEGSNSLEAASKLICSYKILAEFAFL